MTAALLDPINGDVRSHDGEQADAAVALARELLAVSLADESARERRRRERLGRLLADVHGRELILALTDEVLRLNDPAVASRRFAELVHAHPTSAMGVCDGLMLRAGALVAPKIPKLVMPLVVRRVKSETRGIVLPSNDPEFGRHVSSRVADGVRLNVNPLGEAILSEAEADARLATVLAKVERTDVDYVSVKISSIVANLDVLAFDHTIGRVADRLRTVYGAAAAAAPQTFVNLDMEEYRDLDLTIAAFTRVLSEPEFVALDAGIVLQAYLPDSHAAAERLGAWAVERRSAGGGCLKVRLVKGANLAMEAVEAEMHGWIAAPYGTKADVDASYKRLLDSLLRPQWAAAMRVGVASHNLFDVAWAMVRTRTLGAVDRVQFEMLEGMAPAQARAVQALAAREGLDELLLYSPVVADEDFDASIAYLSRRLDENTQADNFLRSLFTLTVDSAEFARQEVMFRDAVAHRHDVSTDHRRLPAPRPSNEFSNEPESDFTDAKLRARIDAALASLELTSPPLAESAAEIDRTVATAVEAATRPADVVTRRRWLADTAETMRRGWVETMAIMSAETGKTVHQADPEIAEAIDFCDYYGAVGIGQLERLADEGYDVRPRGVVAVIAPWNFPFAIPTGGVASALAAGNAVILKPAPEAVHVGARIAELFWAAGVPRDVLQLVVCDDGPVGTRLVTHPDLDTITLTGAYDTAAMFLDWRPELRVLAETSGKNSLVITAAADIDEAIADLVGSAFGHAGQKCSAASLAIVESSVYDDPAFLNRLREAVTSLRVGPSGDTASMMGPVVTKPSGALKRALTSLDAGQEWLVEPRQIGTGGLDGRLWTPGVRIGVEPGSWFHRTECFGPVLGVMRARDLNHAIELQNATDFGLTGGIHSLNPTEIATWLDQVEIGNAYVNRMTTGAIVRRQPFGGWKKSSVGGSAKAGGPGYVQQFARISNGSGDALAAARTSFPSVWNGHFAVEHDPSGLAAETNLLRYVPVDAVLVRHDGTDDVGLDLLRLAAQTTGVPLVESDARSESDADFLEHLDGADRVRLLTTLGEAARRECHQRNVAIIDAPPVSDGFVELYRWVREQSVSRTMHRHGRLNRRA
jgi:RHH-type proline utilization regulon transcriptional repressor/proline dehydrogenase/delta 1-pyrroline-5-carboxylate dehydrogenase